MKKNTGSVVIYIVLLIFVMMTSAAIVLSGILSKHIRASENYLSSEQSFAAANSSIEHMLYKISKQGAVTVDDVKNEGSIEYDDGMKVDYKGSGCSKDGVPLLSASGSYKSLVRRIELGGGNEDCD